MPLFRSLEQRLEADGRPAKADVLSSEPTHHTHEKGAIEQLTARGWKLALRVRPDGDPTFDVDVKQLLDSWYLPWRGNVVDVLYDPGDHSRTILDPRGGPATPRPEWLWDPSTGTTIYKARRAVEEAQQAPAEYRDDLVRLAGFYQSGALFDFEYTELRRRILGLPLVDPRPSIAAALGPDGAGASVRSMADGHEIPLTAAGTPPEAMNDRLAQLEQLADRHDHGELSDAEFDAAKQRILGGQPA